MQDGPNTYLITPPPRATSGLPQPVALATPTLPDSPLTLPTRTAATLSPTASVPSPTTSPSPTTQSPQTSSPTQLPPAGLQPPSPAMAALCVRSLTLLHDLAQLRHRQQPHASTLGLITQAALQRQVALAQQWPALTGLQTAYQALPWGGPQRAELRLAWGTVQQTCQNPAAPPVSRQRVPRPD